MGVYPIPCPSCKKSFMWFSGSTDQRCENCKEPFKEEIKCPKNYGSYDVCSYNCALCKQGLLYRGCSVCGDLPACAGWNDDDGTNCCECYKVKHK